MKFEKSFDINYFQNNTVVIINSCDAYGDVLSVMLRLLSQNWSDNPFQVIINTESNVSSKRKTDGWGGRLLNILSELKCEYVILLMDDFLLEHELNMISLINALSVMAQKKDAAAFYLNYCNSNSTKNDDYFELSSHLDAKLNSHPAIWRRLDLINFTRSYDNPWTWEIFGNYRAHKSKKVFYSVSNEDFDIYKYDYRCGGAIYRGKWVKDVILPLVKKYDIKIDLLARGFANMDVLEKRSLRWKLLFVYLGLRSIGFGFFKYIYFSYKKTKA